MSELERMCFLQQWLGLSGKGLEDPIYDSQAMRVFLGIDIKSVPDATTQLNFPRLLEQHELTQALFE